MFEPIHDLILRHDTIILHRHANPDGDALGSQIGLKHILKDAFPEKTIHQVGDAARRYAFMDDSTMDDVPDEAYRDALAIILDTSARALISDERYALAAATARIDHHLFVEQIADAEAVDPSYESCCGMVADYARKHGLRLSPAAAKALYTGMVTDSGRFRYDGVSARTFELAAYLMEQPFDMGGVYRSLYASDIGQIKLRAQFAMKIELSPNGVAYIYTTLEEQRALKEDAAALSRGMVGVMADIKGVEVWVNFTEAPQGVLCELRSSAHNINPIAVKYGGGGHAMASGATVKDRAQAMAMLRDLDAMLGGTP